jgi:hypothetical protein
MDLVSGLPVWLTWCAAGGAGMVAIAALARSLDAVFDLDRS